MGLVAPFVQPVWPTVWGIYHALVGIGAAGQITLAAVSGPIGEALVAAAAGLAAIPAVVAYNACWTRVNRVDSQEWTALPMIFTRNWCRRRPAWRTGSLTRGPMRRWRKSTPRRWWT